MEKSKLMRPLFCGCFFNRDGRRIRAVFVREVSNGTDTYRLWRKAGKPELEYHHIENDRHILHVEINGYLAPLGETDYFLVHQCGLREAEKELYGRRKEREIFFADLQKSEKGHEQIPDALKKEEAVVQRHGEDPARQADHIFNFLDEHVKTYLEAKENGGKTFPDFIGALVMNELANCTELSTVFRALSDKQTQAKAVVAAEETRAFCEEQNKTVGSAVSYAVYILKNGGVLKRGTVTFYRSQYDSSTYSIFNHLMMLYKINVPFRTQGWINDNLLEATIEEGRCTSVRYLRARGRRCSQKIFDCVNELIQAVKAQSTTGGERC